MGSDLQQQYSRLSNNGWSRFLTCSSKTQGPATMIGPDADRNQSDSKLLSWLGYHSWKVADGSITGNRTRCHTEAWASMQQALLRILDLGIHMISINGGAEAPMLESELYCS